MSKQPIGNSHSDIDKHVCLCFHVSKRKIVNFIRIEKPRRYAQLSECQNAGTGCGWCRPFLKRLFEQMDTTGGLQKAREGEDIIPYDFESMTPEQYARLRAKYVQEGGGTPPSGATP